MVVDTFDMQRQYLSSPMVIFHLIIQLIASRGKEGIVYNLPLSQEYIDTIDKRSSEQEIESVRTE